MTQPPIMAAALASRREQIYPVLNAAQVARFAAFGVEQAFTDGALVWDQGDAGVACYLVLAGALEIVHPECAGPRVITTHEAGEFTGEVALLNDRRSLVRALAVGDLRVLKVEPARFKALIQTDSELSELILRAFILRRVNMLAGGIGDVIVIGSKDSPATLRLQGFLVRNSHPYKALDIDVEPDIQAMLDHFHVAREDVPILICRGERVLKNPSDSEVAECLGFNITIDPDVIRDVVICGAGPGGLAAAVYGASEGLDTLVMSEFAGRASGVQLQDRELLRLPHRHQRASAARTRAHAGGEVRRAARGRVRCGAAALRRATAAHRARERAVDPHADRRDRDGCGVPQAHGCEPRALRARRRVLLGDGRRVTALRARGSHRGGRRKLCRSSGDLPRTYLEESAHADPRPGSRRACRGI